MGYRTYHNLFIRHSKDDSKLSEEQEAEIINELRVEDSDAWYALDKYGDANRDTRWDEVDEDMKAFSLKYPELVFEIAGTGDDAEDLWSTYYKNGKMQHCPVEFIYPPYDETKLV